jgi:AcrR family transcriptional regulator
VPKVSDAHRGARRQQILDAAARCFARKGIHPTTMQDIFRESGLSAGAVYGYFASKDAIVRAIADDWHAWERGLIRDAADAKDVGSGLRELLHAAFERLAEDPERERRRIGIELWAESLHNESVRESAREGIQAPLRMLKQVVERGQQRGEVPSLIDPEALGRVGIALFQGLILQQSWDEVDLPAYVTALDLLLDGLLSRGE